MKPALHLPTYLGGKAASGVPHSIINQIPAHDTFVSGFLGHCAPTRFKLPAQRTIGIDKDPKVIRRWRKLDLDSLNMEAKHADFFEHWQYLPLGNENTFLYLDPPYPHETRRSAHRYDYELHAFDHSILLQLIKKFNCMVMISTYDNNFYQTELASWRKVQFQSQTRGGTPATETLYMNYPEPSPDQLHDPRFLGGGFRQREKSKRRIQTIISKIERLTDAEKAILALELTEKFPDLK